MKAQKEMALVRAETAELEVSHLNTELERIKEQQQIKPTIEAATHEEHVVPDTIKVSPGHPYF
ncbi:hypothetical protein lpari_03957 [Legionella parisiensis]|uniref:Uncharacterized protein n=1 Tax=Legionella parisiensis TaxID=45071 RepID=A0A1E5JKJ5_9GAMM|nr:hypothetical protein lpari_03957 [Legionella parisiensis]